MAGKKRSVGRPWYYRMLLSYIPIFFIISTFLIFLFLQELNSVTREDAVKANRFIATQAMDRLEYPLRSVEDAIEDFIVYKRPLQSISALQAYYMAENARNVDVKLQVLQNIQLIRQRFPEIDSIYLVRNRDRTVLSEKAEFRLEDFPDADFIADIDISNQRRGWTDPRIFRELPTQQPRDVVTLIRSVFTYDGHNGFVAVNVRLEALRDRVAEAVSSDVHFVRVLGGDGAPLFNPDATADNVALYESVSSYSGWKYESGFVQDRLFNAATLLSGLWLKLGIVAVLLGIASIVFVTRQNYRPLESLVARMLKAAPASGDGAVKANAGKNDEFALIESALESMIVRSNSMERQRDEGLQMRKRQFFRELLEGTRTIDADEWRQEAVKSNLPGQIAGTLVVTLEIDGYGQFSRRFTQSDQLLLKYALMNAAQETIQNRGLSVWSEWTTARRLSLLVLAASADTVDAMDAADAGSVRPSDARQEPGHPEPLPKPLEQEAEEAVLALIDWVRGHLSLGITAGIGSRADMPAAIPSSYRDSLEALRYKAVDGAGRIVRNRAGDEATRADIYAYLRQIHGIAYAFKLGEADWETRFERFMDAVAEDRLPAETIGTLMRDLVFRLDKEMSDLAGGLKEIWLESGMNPLNDAIAEFETVEQLRDLFSERLDRLAEKIGEFHEERRQRILAVQIRNRIKEDFTDPDMSLDRLAEQFGLASRYISQLFKDEFGENFIDFVISLRIERAKRLLADSGDSVQEIALAVGYSGAISFTRAFKKVTGIAPGDYRRRGPDRGV